MRDTSAIAIISGITFALAGLAFMLIVTPMAVRSVYTQTPRQSHRSFGRISAWLVALGTEATGLILLAIGVVSLLGLIDHRISELAFAAIDAFIVPYGALYLLVSILLVAIGVLTLFVGRIVSQHRNR